MSDKNYQKAAGKSPITDQEIVDHFGLDPKLVGKKEINQAAMEASLKKLQENLIKSGEYDTNSISDILSAKRKELVHQIKQAEKIAGTKLM